MLRVFQDRLNSVSQRLGELRMDTRQSRKDGLNTWLRGYGQELRFNGKATRFGGHDGEPFDERQIGADIGMDYKFSGAGAGIYIGAFFGYGQIERTFDTGGRASNSYFAAVNHAESTTDSIYGGAYATIITAGGWYLDGVLKANGFDNKLSTSAVTGETMDGKYGTSAIGGSLELGKYIDCGNGWFAEPQAQVAHVILSGGDYTTSNDIDVELRWGATTQARAGLRIGRVHRADSGGILQAYLKACHGSQWTIAGQIITNGDRFSPTIKGDHFDCGGGIAWLAGNRFQIHLDFETGRTSYYNKPWGVNLGLRYGW